MYRDHSGKPNQPPRKLQPDLLIHGLPSTTMGRLAKFVDVTVHDPCNITHLYRSLRPLPAPTDRSGRPLPQQRLIGGGAAAAAELNKHWEAEKNLGDHVCSEDFAAFGAEHFGALGPEASALLHQMAAHSHATGSGTGRANWNASSFRHYAAQAVSIALHSGVGQQMQMRASALRNDHRHAQQDAPPATAVPIQGEHSPAVASTRPATPGTTVLHPQPTMGPAAAPALVPARAGLLQTSTTGTGASNIIRRMSPPRDGASGRKRDASTDASWDPSPAMQPARKRRARSRSNGHSRRRWAQQQQHNRKANSRNSVP